MEESIMGKLLEIGVSMVVHRCGPKDGEITQIEQADFHDYRWSGIIDGDQAIFEWNEHLEKKDEEEMSAEERREERKYHVINVMQDIWCELRKKNG